MKSCPKYQNICSWRKITFQLCAQPLSTWKGPLTPVLFSINTILNPMHLWLRFTLSFKMLVCISNFAANTVLPFHYYFTIYIAPTYFYQYFKCEFLIKHVSIPATYQSSANKHFDLKTSILTVLTCFGLGDISRLEIFFLLSCNFQRKGQK